MCLLLINKNNLNEKKWNESMEFRDSSSLIDSFYFFFYYRDIINLISNSTITLSFYNIQTYLKQNIYHIPPKNCAISREKFHWFTYKSISNIPKWFHQSLKTTWNLLLKLTKDEVRKILPFLAQPPQPPEPPKPPFYRHISCLTTSTFHGLNQKILCLYPSM